MTTESCERKGNAEANQLSTHSNGLNSFRPLGGNRAHWALVCGVLIPWTLLPPALQAMTNRDENDATLWHINLPRYGYGYY